MFKPESLISYAVAGLLVILIATYMFNNEKPGVAEPRPEPVSHISVAINQKGELMIVDRENGTYQVFSDTVGRAIYELYNRKAVK